MPRLERLSSDQRKLLRKIERDWIDHLFRTDVVRIDAMALAAESAVMRCGWSLHLFESVCLVCDRPRLIDHPHVHGDTKNTEIRLVFRDGFEAVHDPHPLRTAKLEKRPAVVKSSLDSLSWQPDDSFGRGVLARAVLPAWARYGCEQGSPDLQGADVEFVVIQDGCARFADTDPSVRVGLAWVLDHDQALHDAASSAFVGHLPTLRERLREWGDTSLQRVTRGEHLVDLVNLARVHVFAHGADGLPYIGLEFDVEWSVHGYHLLMLGTRCVAIDVESSSVALADILGRAP